MKNIKPIIKPGIDKPIIKPNIDKPDKKPSVKPGTPWHVPAPKVNPKPKG